MDKKYCRLDDSNLIALGLNPDQTPDSDHCVYSRYMEKPTLDMIRIARGKFGQILDVLYDNDNGNLNNNLRSLVSENAPIEIREFVNNVLLCPIQALKSAPDDDTAFDLIIPRSKQTSSELQPYLDVMRKSVSDARQRYLDSQHSKTD